MAVPLLTDDEIDDLTPAERRELIVRLSRPAHTLVPTERARRQRRIRLTLFAVCSLALLPWTFYIGAVLPDEYVVHHWWFTWVGFDLLLFALLTTTVVLGLLRRQLVALTAFASGMLLFVDGWFDVMLSESGDRWFSVATALLLEVPIGLVLISASLRLVKLTAAQLWLVEPGRRLWHVPIPFTDG